MKVVKFIKRTLVIAITLCLILGIRISLDSSGYSVSLKVKPQFEARASEGLGWPQNTIEYWPDTISRSDGCIVDVRIQIITNTCVFGLWSCTPEITVGGTTYASQWACFDDIFD